ncbi:unnamed protein product [Gordionus sp. m RMFG-2023]
MYNLKGQLLISSININGLCEKFAVLLKLMLDENMDIIAIQETHCQGNSTASFNNFIFYGSGTTLNSWSGVGFLINKKIYKYIDKFVPVSERCGLLYLNTNFRKTILINIYVPLNRRDRLLFFDDLENIINALPMRFNIILIGDVNTKIGLEETYKNRGIIGNATLVQSNRDDSRKLLDLCDSINFKIENTFFQHRETNTYTFYRGSFRSQIDFFISNVHSWFKDVTAMTNINLSNHRMIKAKILIRNIWGTFGRTNHTSHLQTNTLSRLNVRNLQNPEIKDRFNRNLCGKIISFEDIAPSKTVEECWSIFKEQINEASRALTNNNAPMRNEWISRSTSLLIEQ